jgi:rhodanese-related sulfurtransferase
MNPSADTHHPPSPTGPGDLARRGLRRGGIALGKSVVMTVAVTLLALAFNAARSKRGIDLFARAPYDIYTDCPEMDTNIPRLKPSRVKAGNRGLVLVDARPAATYLAGHIQGARSMPMYGTRPNAPGGLDYLRKMRGRFIVIYGQDQMQSAVHLASYLRQNKVRGVHLLDGDLAAWKKAGRKLTKKAIGQVAAADLVGSSGPLYVDARPPEQYRAGHIPGARNVPCDGLIPPDPKQFAALLASKRPLVTYGVSEVDEELAEPGTDTKPKDVGRLLAAELVALGAGRVRWLPGGTDAWKKGGGKLVQTQAVEPKGAQP